MTFEFNTADIMQAFRDDVSRFGLTPPANIEPGRIFRCRAEGKKTGYPGWGVIHMNPDGTAGGCIGNHVNGDKHKVFYGRSGEHRNYHDLTPDERAAFQKMIDEAKAKAEADQKARYDKTAAAALRIWNKAKPADPGHQYAKDKGINLYDARQTGKTLLIPRYNAAGRLMSLQYIYPDGFKKNQTDGQTTGGFVIIGDPAKSDTIYDCEGYATGATLHQATGQAVAVAFTANNLDAVTGIMKKRYPDKRIIIAADNDIETAKRRPDLGNPGRKAAEAAAAKHGVGLSICPMDSDFNDLHQAQGLDAVREALGRVLWNSEGAGLDHWDPIVPLDALEVDRIDPATLPGIVGEYAQAVARETETPLELAAGMLFVVIAACVQGRVKIQVKAGYSEPLVFWTVAPMPPATRKSQVLKRITAPLTDWERRKRAEHEPLIKARRIERENTQARIKALRTKFGKAKQEELQGIADEIMDLENGLEPELVSPQIWAQDCTPENAGQIMARNDERLTILAAEGGVLDTLGGRYSSGVANLDLFLQGYSGDSVKVNRTSRADIFLNKPALSLGLMPQPQVIGGTASKPEFKGRGFIGRPFYMMPESNLGARTLDSEPIPDRLKYSYVQTIETLLEIQPIEHPDGTTEPHVLTLSGEAFREWRDFYMAIEHDLADGGRFEHCRDWAGKTPGRAARLAGLLHCAMNPVEPWRCPVSRETMEQALDITVVSCSHALAVFNLLGADPAIDSAARVLKWIKRHQHQTFTKRQAFEALKGTFSRAAMLDEPLKVLTERNYIRAIVPEKGPGRPPEPFEVNPAFHQGGEHGLA